jgi:hypothetical protein
MEMRMAALSQTAPDWPGDIAQALFRPAWSLLGPLMTPVAAAAGALAAWRFGADVGWTNSFFIAGGFLSHWQVWCAFAISAQACAYSLKRVKSNRPARMPALIPLKSLSGRDDQVTP